MQTRIYTIHSRGRPNELRAVGDGFRQIGSVPPLWAAWRRLWLTLAIMLVLIGGAALVQTGLFGIVWLALMLVAMLEGAEIERLELRLRGWREVGVVEARSEAGAEELFLTRPRE